MASKLATEIVGGVICTATHSERFQQPRNFRLRKKVFKKGRASISYENRVRIARLLEYLIRRGSIVPTNTSHGGGAAAVQKLLIRNSNNLSILRTAPK